MVMTRTAALALVAAIALPASLSAESGALVTGLSYSDRYGGTGHLGLEFAGLFDGALDLSLGYRAGDRGRQGTANLVYRYRLGEALGGPAFLRFGLFGDIAEWASNPFHTESWGASVGVEVAATPQLTWTAGLAYSTARLTGPGMNLSPVLAQDLGRSDVTSLEIGLGWASLPGAGTFDPNFRISGQLGHALSGDMDRDWTRARLNLGATVPAFGPSVLILSAEGSVISSNANSGRVHALDRYFADGRSPRGFAFGSPGPIDPVTKDALGGTRQLALSVEMRTPLPREGLSLGVFADAGSVWDLAGHADPTLDDGFDLRSSVGISLGWEMRFGRLEASLARAVQYSDHDLRRSFSLGFVSRF